MSMRIRDDAISRLSRRPGFRDAYYENRALVVESEIETPYGVMVRKSWYRDDGSIRAKTWLE
jgi:hypothetical protein